MNKKAEKILDMIPENVKKMYNLEELSALQTLELIYDIPSDYFFSDFSYSDYHFSDNHLNEKELKNALKKLPSYRKMVDFGKYFKYIPTFVNKIKIIVTPSNYELLSKIPNHVSSIVMTTGGIDSEEEEEILFDNILKQFPKLPKSINEFGFMEIDSFEMFEKYIKNLPENVKTVIMRYTIEGKISDNRLFNILEKKPSIEKIIISSEFKPQYKKTLEMLRKRQLKCETLYALIEKAQQDPEFMKNIKDDEDVEYTKLLNLPPEMVSKILKQTCDHEIEDEKLKQAKFYLNFENPGVLFL